MGLIKKSLLTFFILICISCQHEDIGNNNANETESDDSSKIEFLEYTKSLIDRLGLNAKGSLNKEELSDFLYKLITKDEDVEYLEAVLYKQAVKKIVDTAPEVIHVNEIHNYAEHDFLIKHINDAINDQEDSHKDDL